VDIGANPSAEGGGDDEGTDDQAVKVVDIVDTFRLQVICRPWSIKYVLYSMHLFTVLSMHYLLQEQPPYDKKQFVAYMKGYIKSISKTLEGEELDCFMKNVQPATKYLLGMIKELQLYVLFALSATLHTCTTYVA
jgi:hypothetical protein